MQDRRLLSLVFVIIVAVVALWIALPISHPAAITNLFFWQPEGYRSLELKQGLDLQGGVQVLLEADVPASTTIDSSAMEAAKVVVENRVNGLGVAEYWPHYTETYQEGE
ncbi:MAG: hypothetical protein ACK2U9_11105, partial [Anaerolineae bacterium]